jgi:hypothetical protein
VIPDSVLETGPKEPVITPQMVIKLSKNIKHSNILFKRHTYRLVKEELQNQTKPTKAFWVGAQT